MPTPSSISAFPVRGYSIAEDMVCVNALVQPPLVVAGRPASAWEGYNYKSFPGRLLVVICTAVDRGWPKGTLKPSSVGGLGIEGEARCGPAKRFRRIPNAVAGGGFAPSQLWRALLTSELLTERQ